MSVGLVFARMRQFTLTSATSSGKHRWSCSVPVTSSFIAWTNTTSAWRAVAEVRGQGCCLNQGQAANVWQCYVTYAVYIGSRSVGQSVAKKNTVTLDFVLLSSRSHKAKEEGSYGKQLHHLHLQAQQLSWLTFKFNSTCTPSHRGAWFWLISCCDLKCMHVYILNLNHNCCAVHADYIR